MNNKEIQNEKMNEYINEGNDGEYEEYLNENISSLEREYLETYRDEFDEFCRMCYKDFKEND